MTFKKVNPSEELEKLKEDKECAEHIENFEKQYIQNEENGRVVKQMVCGAGATMKLNEYM